MAIIALTLADNRRRSAIKSFLRKTDQEGFDRMKRQEKTFLKSVSLNEVERSLIEKGVNREFIDEDSTFVKVRSSHIWREE